MRGQNGSYLWHIESHNYSNVKTDKHGRKNHGGFELENERIMKRMNFWEKNPTDIKAETSKFNSTQNEEEDMTHN